MTDFNPDLHSENIIKEHLANTVLLWGGTFKGKKFYKLPKSPLTYPNEVTIKAVELNPVYGWCVTFNNDYNTTLFRPFSMFVQEYSCLKQ